jgi:glyoxylase-like metal-dependent hydrolase (beta-lactamase superfamily II)
MQILPGIYLTNGSPYGRHQNSYLVQAHGATILIDSGDLEDSPSLPDAERNAQRWGLALDRASHLFVTHSHFDHASHAAELQRRGLKVVASAATAEAMAAGDERCIGYAVHKQFPPCRAGLIVQDQQVVQVGDLRVQCLAAPGHAAGLMVFSVPVHGEVCWFVGDLLLTSHAHRSIELGWNGGPDYDRAAYLETLQRLVRRPVDHVLPGHGPAAIGCGRRVIEVAYTAARMKWQ